MDMDPNDEQSTMSQPVAYDDEGRPLYHHPVQPETPAPEPVKRTQVTSKPSSIEGQNFSPHLRTQYANEQRVVHATRPHEPTRYEISDELRRKSERSRERYPRLNLSEGEYVILDIKRHPIGMMATIGISFALLIAVFAFLALYPTLYDSSMGIFMPNPSVVYVVCLLISIASILGGSLALWVYLQNQFFLTNECVIQEIQEGPFSRHEQTVSLGSIEDASYRRSGILQTALDYGTIRLSTEGEETTYIFRYVSNPRRQIAILNNAIEDFKNGRPVADVDD